MFQTINNKTLNLVKMMNEMNLLIICGSLSKVKTGLPGRVHSGATELWHDASTLAAAVSSPSALKYTHHPLLIQYNFKKNSYMTLSSPKRIASSHKPLQVEERNLHNSNR